MAARDNLSKLFSQLIEDATTDATLVGRLEGFLETIRPPTFPVKQETIRIVESRWSDDFKWESLTTDLGQLGFEFGDVVVDGKENCLRRVIAYDKGDNLLWFTDKNYSDNAMKAKFVSGRFERYDPNDAAVRDRLSSILSAGGDDVMDRARAELQKVPHFKVPQNGLKLTGTWFGWDDTTAKLAERGFKFGDVVVDKTKNRLHRVVALKGGELWITSATCKNGIAFDANPDDFVKA